MADFDDLSFDRAPAPEPPPEPPPGPSVWPVVAIVGLVAGLGALWYFGTATRTPAPESAPAAAPKSVAQTSVDLPRRSAEPGEQIDLPPLDQSDAVVRMLVGRLSSHPAIAAWLTTNGLIRNLTVVVANIADGETPAKHLAPLRPKGSFATRTSAGLTWIDPASYQRYDGVTAAVDSLDARGVARFYATVKPRIDDAYRDLAGGDANFDKTLERAIVMLLRTPVPGEQIQVQSVKMTYAYADPALEGLTKAQRQFLRMGPRNVRIVKAKIRAVAGFLGIPDTALPPPDR
jgi:hypothetical protein